MADSGGRRKDREENSCVLQPTFKNKFHPKAVEASILEILNEELAELAYDQDKCSGMCKNLCDKIKMRLRNIEPKLDRYKFAVQVFIGELKRAAPTPDGLANAEGPFNPGVTLGLRCFWDDNIDNYASATYKNDTLFCTAVAFAIYNY